VTEGTEPSRLDDRLAKAQDLVARGRQRQALDELWQAEAPARGDVGSLQQMSEFVASLQQQLGPKQASRLAELADVLQHDIETALRPRGTADSPPKSLAKGLAMALLWATFGGFAGAIIGGIVGRLTENPNEFLASLDPAVGAIIGFPIGVLVGLVLYTVFGS
jgi:hypothetical protein